MLDIPGHLRFTEEHEWVRDDGGTFVVGITQFAAEQLGDITFVELPPPDGVVRQGDEIATVESVKAASDVYAPVGGVIVEVNSVLEDQPEIINESPYEKGWFIKLEEVDTAELDKLMDAVQYAAFVKEQ